MKVGIVGGGISGLYISKLLEEKNHDVSIFESNKWGGEIETITIDNICYPVSALVCMYNNKLLKDELKKNNIKLVSIEDSSVLNIRPYMLITIILAIIAYYKKPDYLFFIIIVMLLIIIILIGSSICNINLLFGTYDKCNMESFKRGFLSISKLIHYIFPDITSKMAEKCGFKRYIDILLQNKNINYINDKVVKINRDENILSTQTQDYKFDKIIVACGYSYYKDIISLSHTEQKLLSDINHHIFYSTIVKYKDDVNYIQLSSKNDILGYIKLDKCVYLYASNKPLSKNSNAIFQKT